MDYQSVALGQQRTPFAECTLLSVAHCGSVIGTDSRTVLAQGPVSRPSLCPSARHGSLKKTRRAGSRINRIVRAVWSLSART
jgi:hypothetical protein